MLWEIEVKDAGDGSDDVIIEIPHELLEKLGWHLGDALVVKLCAGGLQLSKVD